jgi:cell division protein ZapA (FtsZ GTPase activity inhibitor)
MKSIEVTIAGRPFPLKVSQEEEALLHRVVDEINEKVRNLQHTYSQKDKQDCLSMTLLTYALENARMHEELRNTGELQGIADQIEQTILQITL